MDMTPDQHIDTVRQLAEVKSGLSALVHSIEELAKRMEAVSYLTQDIVRLQVQQTENSLSIKRAFERMEKHDEVDSDRMQVLLNVKSQTERWINRSIGGWAVGVILFGAIQWLINGRVENYERNQTAHSETLVTIDRRLSWIEYEMKQAAKSGVKQ